MTEKDYNIIRSKRKSISIEVDRLGQVIVRAPLRAPNYAIKDFVCQKQGWINKHVEKAIDKRLNMIDVVPLTDDELDSLFVQAKQDIPNRVSYYADIMGADYGRITIRCQKTRWGSCSYKGNLNFNCLLMLAPSVVRDYVIIHELAHRKYMNHSRDFWKEVELIMPDYRDMRRWLKEHGDELMQRVSR